MIPDAVLSCSYLLLGSGTCIYRVINYSYEQFSTVLPQYISLSIGITAIGIRSIFCLTYNLSWRHYAIDPLLIEQELLNENEDEHLIESGLCTVGLGSMVYALYLHYNYIITGTVVILSMTLMEMIICICKESMKYLQYRNRIENFITWANTRSYIPHLITKYFICTWIFTTELLLGFAMNNNYICTANIPFGLTMIIYRPFGLYQKWSIRNSVNDYMMLVYIILITEALIQS